MAKTDLRVGNYAADDNLIEKWDNAQRKPFQMKVEYGGAGGGVVLWSFANHVVNLMRTVLELSEDDHMVRAVPLIRLMVENTMTGIWLYLDPVNVRVLLREGFRLRKAAIANVMETGANVFDQSDLDELDATLSEFDTAKYPKFEALCRQIEGGLEVYCTWRVLSAYSHAGMAMGDFYLREIDEEPGLAMMPDAKLENHESSLGTALCMLITAMKLYNNIDYRGSLTSQLDRAAKRVGISLNFARASTKVQ